MRRETEELEPTAGDEFLVADPLSISALSSLFKSAQRPQHDFDAKGIPFGKATQPSKLSSDLFSKLPEELRSMIVTSLSSRDIASLRSASRTFRHLPYTLWHDLMKKEMPWIWEAWSDRPYPLMSRTTKKELMAHDEAIKSRIQAAARLPKKQKIYQEELIARDEADFRKARPVQKLDRLHNDWYFLYCQLRREWKNIKGLQNRERIWKAAEFVIRRISHPDEDFEIAQAEHSKAFACQDLCSHDSAPAYGGTLGINSQSSASNERSQASEDEQEASEDELQTSEDEQQASSDGNDVGEIISEAEDDSE